MKKAVKRITVGIIDNGILYSDFSKLILGEQEISLRGGIIYRKNFSIPLKSVDCVAYSSVFPKFRFRLTNGDYTVTIQLFWWSKKTLLTYLKEKGILSEKRKTTQGNLFQRISSWYQFWYFIPLE